MGRKLGPSVVVNLLAHLFYLHPAQIMGFLHLDRPKCHPPVGKTHESRFAILGSPIYLALAYEITTLENYLPQKVSPAREKHYFLQFPLN